MIRKKNKDKGGGSLPLAPARKRSSTTPSPRGSAPKTKMRYLVNTKFLQV